MLRRHHLLPALAWGAVLFSAGLGIEAQAPPAAGAAPKAVPPIIDVVEASIPDLQAAMQEGRVTARALVDAYLARIAAYDKRGPSLNAVVTLNPRAREEADALDHERASRGPRGPLHGIPILVKDNYDTVDMPTTAGTLALSTLQPSSDAFQVGRLREAGAVILGKTAMHELASGITNTASLTGQTLNPYDLARNPGGSSGGTGAAVAASFAAAGMGSDTCGSIRIPASHNNLVGLRATLGLSSRSGVIPLSHTQDIAGPLARTVTDLALVLDATVGADPADPVTRRGVGRIPGSYRDALSPAGLEGVRIGVLGALFGNQPDDDEAAQVVRKALEDMRKLGADTVDVVVPGLEEQLRDSSVIDDEFKFDLAEYLAKVPGAPVGSLGEILDRGLYHAALDVGLRRRNAVETPDSEHYRRALVKREALTALVGAAMDEHRLDALAYPTIRRRPAIVGEPQTGSNCQLSASTGLPAISIPAGFTAEGSPMGIELLGRAFTEADLLKMAFAFEQATRYRRAPVHTPPLVNGDAPPPVSVDVALGAERPGGPDASPPGVRARFTLDPVTSRLDYSVALSTLGGDRVVAVTLQRGEQDRPGPVLYQLATADQTAGKGTLTLRPRDRADLDAGRVYLHLYTRQRPLGAGRVRVGFPSSP